MCVDHRTIPTFAADDLSAAMRAFWDLTPNARFRIEAVHRLSSFGAVATHTAEAISVEGSSVEWRVVMIITVEGERFKHWELFDEAHLDVALTRFDELSRPTLTNAASQAFQRLRAYYVACDWAAVAEVLADDISTDDRRSVVNAGTRHGRDAEIANMKAVREIATTNTTSWPPATVIAIRGNRLALCRAELLGPDQEFNIEMLLVTEVDTDDRIAAHIVVDPDDIDAAFEELDARYLAGEAAANADTWSVIAGVAARFNRRELPTTTPEPVYIDHRPLVSIDDADLAASIRAVWDITSDASVYIEAVHQLSERGAVFTYVLKMTTHEGLDAEVRMIMMFTLEGDLISRVEVFDEADLDLSLAKFEELQPHARPLENAATRTWARSIDAFNRREMADYLALMTTDGRLEDRRKGLRGLFDGTARRKAVHALFEGALESWRLSMEPIAIRGSRLSLSRERCRDTDAPDQPITVEVLTVVEVEDDLVHHTVSFDPDDLDAAFEELDARYRAGEAAAHAETWSVVTRAYAALNRRELPPAKPDWVNIDHRRVATFAPGELTAFIRAAWDLERDHRNRIETVHRVNRLGAVVTPV